MPFLRYSVYLLAVVTLTGCVTQRTADNSTSYRYTPDFAAVVTESGELKASQISVLPMAPVHREAGITGGLAGGIGDRLPEDEKAEITSKVNDAIFGPSKGLGFNYSSARAQCGMALNAAPFYRGVFKRPLISNDNMELFNTALDLVEYAMEAPRTVPLEGEVGECIKSQGRYVLVLRRDVLKERAFYAGSAEDSTASRLGRRFIHDIARANAPPPSWNYANFVLVDTQTSKLLSYGQTNNGGPVVINMSSGNAPIDYQRFKRVLGEDFMRARNAQNKPM